jgi:hypothetical protein
MVNASLLRPEDACGKPPPRSCPAAIGDGRFTPPEQANGGRSEMFAQILGKLNFFNLRENLRLILLDYEENRSRTTNGPFKSAC